METTFKLKLTKLFQSSFTSCRTKHISDVADQPFVGPDNNEIKHKHEIFDGKKTKNRHHGHLIDLFSPKPQPLSSSSCKPKPHLPKPKISDQKTLFPAATVAGKPYSVSTPLFHQKTQKSTKKKKSHHRNTTKIHSFQSVTDNYYYDCCSSDEDDLETDDQTTLFSSLSFSSDSTISFKRNMNKANKSNKERRRRSRNRGGVSGCKDRKSTDVIQIKGKGKFVKDSVAVVKKSSDPHEDFRVSMLEMIVERQIFGGKDLENLLQCFLSLNSEEHHRVICEVYTEIWETLFSDLL